MTVEENIVAIANEKLNRDAKLRVEDLGLSLRDCGIDSLDFMLILVGVQEQFGVEIPDSKVPEFGSLQSVVDFVKANKAS